VSYVFEKFAFELPLERCLMLDELQSYYFNKYKERCLVVIPTVSTTPWRMEFSLICSNFFFLLCFQSLEVRGFSICFFCLKCWPSLFKLPEMWKKVNVWVPVDAVNLSVPGPNVVSGSLTIFWCSSVHVNSWPK
jgi:hypothetical protein